MQAGQKVTALFVSRSFSVLLARTVSGRNAGEWMHIAMKPLLVEIDAM